MKFEINRLEMLGAARKTAKVAPSNSPVEVLNGILIECGDDSPEAVLTASNHDTAIQCKVKASVSESGGMLIQAVKLVDMLSLLSSEHVEFSELTNGMLRITGGSAVYQIRCLPVKHYPRPVLPFPEETVKIEGICSLYKKTVIAAAKDENKAALCCISLKINRGVLQAAACDGMKMMLVKGVSESTEAQDFLIPAEPFGQLAAISSDADTYDVGDVGNEIVFSREGVLFSIKKLGGTFVDYMTLLKSIAPQYSAVLEVNSLRTVLDSFSVVSGAQPVNLVLSKDSVRLTCNGDLGAMASSVPALVKAETPENGFLYNLAWLLKALQALNGKIRLEMDKTGFMLIKSAAEVYLQLPMANRDKAKKAGNKNKSTASEVAEEAEDAA